MGTIGCNCKNSKPDQSSVLNTEKNIQNLEETAVPTEQKENTMERKPSSEFEQLKNESVEIVKEIKPIKNLKRNTFLQDLKTICHVDDASHFLHIRKPSKDALFQVKKVSFSLSESQDEGEEKNVASVADIQGLSKLIFDQLNDFRRNPEKYEKQSTSHNLESIFTKAKMPIAKPSSLLWSNKKFEVVSDFLVNVKTEMSAEKKALLISKLLDHASDEKYTGIIFQSNATSDTEEAIWNLLVSSKAYASRILMDSFEFCIVCAIAVPQSTQVEVTYIFLNLAEES